MQLANKRSWGKTALVSIFLGFLVAVPNSVEFASAVDPSQIVFNEGGNSCQLSTAGYLGDGTPETPYQISDSDSLWEIPDCDQTASGAMYFKIINDIDVSQALFAPTQSPISTVSMAVIDGQGHTVAFSMSTSGEAGLFLSAVNSEFKNLVLTGSVFSDGNDVGALIAKIANPGIVTVSNVINRAPIRGVNRVGGIVGNADAKPVSFFSVSNEATVTGTSTIGGLIGSWGSSFFSTISESRNVGEIKATAMMAGGLVGAVGNGLVEIKGSYNSGAIFADTKRAGGLVGRVGIASGAFQVQNSFNYGNVSSPLEVGGLMGNKTQSSIYSVANFINFATTVGEDGLTSYDNLQIDGAYSLAPSKYVAPTSTPSQLRVASSFTSGTWDFENVWGYGPCGTNGDFPQLRSFGLAQAYDSTACYSYASFDVQGGSPAPAQQTFTSSGELAVPSNPGKTGYSLAGWTEELGGSLVSFPYGPGVTQSVTLYASWSPLTYVVTFDAKGGSAVPDGAFSTGGSVSLPSASQKTGLCLSGWTSTDNPSATPVSFPYAPGVTSAITLYAKWETCYAFQFEANGGTSVDAAYFLSGASVQAPADPTRAGYSFTGWTLTGSSVALAFPYSPGVNQDVTVYALWSQNPSDNQAQVPAYSGPTLISNNEPVAPGSTVVFSGSKLGLITSAYVGEALAEIIEQTPGSITIELPIGLDEGSHDLLVYSKYGRLSVLDAVYVLSSTEVPSSDDSRAGSVVPVFDSTKLPIGKTRTLPTFSNGQKSLTTKQSAWLKNNLEGSGLTKIICTGVIAGDMTMHQKIQVRKLAKATCVEAAKHLANPSTWYQSKLTTKVAYIRKVMVTFRG